MSSIDTQHKAIEFLVAEPPKVMKLSGRPPICGFTWLIESSRTSFYIKSLVPTWGFAKISLHGPDPKEADPHNRLDLESKNDLILRALRSGARWSPEFGLGPMYFEGKSVNRRAMHVVRFATSWELFTKGAPSGPAPVLRGKATQKKRFDPPPRFKVLYIDLFVGSVRPYWPDGEQAARSRGWYLGPLKNEAGQFLTGLAHAEDQAGEPDPFKPEREGRPARECFRDLGYRVAEDDVLWVCETLVSPERRPSLALPPV